MPEALYDLPVPALSMKSEAVLVVEGCMGMKPRAKKAAKKTVYKLYVSYDLNHHEWGSLDKKLDKAVGKGDDGAGTGFGMRDIDWSFDTYEELKAAEGRVRDLNLRYVMISVDWYEDED